MFDRPTLAELKQRIQADMVSRLELKGGIMRRSVVGVISTALAGCSHLWHGHMDWVSKQILTDSMDEDYLLREALIYGITRKAAVAASGKVIFTGDVAAVVPAGTMLKRVSDGAMFTTLEDGLSSVSAMAQEAGDAGNADAGAVLNLVSPVSGVKSAATVGIGGITGGSDIESIESLRPRVIARKQQPPQGGNKQDYVTWALEVAGVTRAWCFPGYMGLGTVGVTFARDDDASFIPDTDEIAEVKAYVEKKRPVTADVYVFAPTSKVVDITILLAPNTVDVQASVQSELEAFFKREGAPGATIYLSRLSEAISSVLSEVHHKISVPSSDVTTTSYEIAVLGTVTFNAYP